MCNITHPVVPYPWAIYTYMSPPTLPLCLRLHGDNALRQVFDKRNQADLSKYIQSCMRTRSYRQRVNTIQFNSTYRRVKRI